MNRFAFAALITMISYPVVSVQAAEPVANRTATSTMSVTLAENNSSKISLSKANELVKEFRQMMIGANRSGFVYPKPSWGGPADRNYNVKGSKIRKFLHYERQNCGINLGWTSNANAETAKKRSRWFFARRGNDKGPILYGESVAMGFGKSPSFIKYDHRTIGINLDWSKSPVYEWKILGGEPGTPVRTGGNNWVVIYNVAHQEPLIYFERDDPCGTADIGWPDSETWKSQVKRYLKDKAFEEGKKLAIATLIGG